MTQAMTTDQAAITQSVLAAEIVISDYPRCDAGGLPVDVHLRLSVLQTPDSCSGLVAGFTAAWWALGCGNGKTGASMLGVI